MSKKAAIALAFLSLTSFAAPAEDAPAPAGGHFQACADDVKKFCANVERGKGQIRACLESHTSELAEACKTRLAEHAAKAKEQAPAQ